MDDIFYKLRQPDIECVKSILRWAHKNALKTQIDLLDCRKSIARVRANRGFEEVLSAMTESALDYYRIILRKDGITWGIISETYERKDYLEIGICGIRIEGLEHFIFTYLNESKLGALQTKYELIPLR